MGSDLAERWEILPAPYAKLSEAIETRLGVVVVRLPAPRGISGAACRLEEFDGILINACEPAHRQHFDLAHELFHILTWESIPPKPLEASGAPGKDRSRAEKFADNFAAGLLLPTASLAKHWERRPDSKLAAFVKQLAGEYQVSGEALFYRLLNLGWLTDDEAGFLRRCSLKQPSQSGPSRTATRFDLGSLFTRRLHTALADGRVTARKAAQVLGCTIDDLRDVCAEYGLPDPIAG